MINEGNLALRIKEVLSTDISLDKAQLDKIRQGALGFLEGIPGYKDDKPAREWLITAQSGGANKYHYYMVLADGSGWKGNGRIGAAPVMNPVEPKVSGRTAEEEIKRIISYKTSGGEYTVQDIAAIDAGTAVAKHAGNDPHKVEPAITAAIQKVGVVQELNPHTGVLELGYYFTYKGNKGEVVARTTGWVGLKFGYKKYQYSIRKDKDLGSWEKALEFVQNFLSKPEGLDKLVTALED